MRPNDRCLSLYDEWTRSLEGCGGAVFDAHRLSFRILPVLETTCHRAAESQVVVDARHSVDYPLVLVPGLLAPATLITKTEVLTSEQISLVPSVHNPKTWD